MPSEPGHLDPVVFVRGQPLLMSMLTEPGSWLLEEPPRFVDFPRGFLCGQNYVEMVKFEVERGFSYLFTEETCHRHPEGMLVEN